MNTRNGLLAGLLAFITACGSSSGTAKRLEPILCGLEGQPVCEQGKDVIVGKGITDIVDSNEDSTTDTTEDPTEKGEIFSNTPSTNSNNSSTNSTNPEPTTTIIRYAYLPSSLSLYPSWLTLGYRVIVQDKELDMYSNSPTLSIIPQALMLSASLDAYSGTITTTPIWKESAVLGKSNSENSDLNIRLYNCSTTCPEQPKYQAYLQASTNPTNNIIATGNSVTETELVSILLANPSSLTSTIIDTIEYRKGQWFPKDSTESIK